MFLMGYAGTIKIINEVTEKEVSFDSAEELTTFLQYQNPTFLQRYINQLSDRFVITGSGESIIVTAKPSNEQIPETCEVVRI